MSIPFLYVLALCIYLALGVVDIVDETKEPWEMLGIRVELLDDEEEEDDFYYEEDEDAA
jgi:hypothetical protein